MKVVIADDEPLARSRLARLLAAHPAYQLVAEAENGQQALECAARHSADLVLLDIAMPGEDGLTTAARLGQLQPPPAVVFVTAHPQHALAAFQVAPAGYLLKPVSAAQLADCLNRLGVSTKAHLERQKALEPRLSFRIGNEQRSIALSELCYLQAEDKYVRLVFDGGEALSELSLKQWQQKYPQQLVRVHRNTLVLATRIRGICRGSNGEHRLLLRGCAGQPEISRRELALLRERLSQQDLTD